MATAGPVSSEERQRIADLLAEGRSRNAVAKRVGRSSSTVSRIASELGHKFPETVAMKAAHEAQKAYTTERRAELAGRASIRVGELLEGWDEGVEHVVSTPLGPTTVTLAPTPRDHRDRANAVGALMRVILNVHAHDTGGDADLSAFGQWLAHMAGGDAGAG